MILKHLAKVYIVISLTLIIGYLLVVFFWKLSFFDYRILTTLIVNATLGVPIVIHRKLGSRERKVVTKILKCITLSLFVFTMVLIYWIPRGSSPASGWEIYVVWFGNSVLLPPIGIIEKGIRNNKGKNYDTTNSTVLIFYIGLMIWSIFILEVAINPFQ